MQFSNKETVSRREFLRSSARYGWLLGLGAALAWLTTRRSNQECSNTSSPCVSCPAFNNCALPSALTAKEGEGATSSRSNNSSEPSGDDIQDTSNETTL